MNTHPNNNITTPLTILEISSVTNMSRTVILLKHYNGLLSIYEYRNNTLLKLYSFILFTINNTNTVFSICKDIIFIKGNDMLIVKINNLGVFIHKSVQVDSIVCIGSKEEGDMDVLEGVSDIDSGLEGVSDIDSGLEGVSDIDSGLEVVNNTTNEQQGVNHISNNQQGVNHISNNQQGVNHISNKQQGLNHISNKQQGVNNTTNNQQGVNHISNKQQGVNNSTKEQQGVNNSIHNQHPYNTHTYTNPYNNKTFNLNTTPPTNNTNTHTYTNPYNNKTFNLNTTPLTNTLYIYISKGILFESKINYFISDNLYEEFKIKRKSKGITYCEKEECIIIARVEETRFRGSDIKGDVDISNRDISNVDISNVDISNVDIDISNRDSNINSILDSNNNTNINTSNTNINNSNTNINTNTLPTPINNKNNTNNNTLPLTYSYSLDLYRCNTLIDSYKLQLNEYICMVKYMLLNNTQEVLPYIIICTSYIKGEDNICKGRLIILKIKSVIPQINKPLTTLRLGVIAIENTKGPVICCDVLRYKIVVCIGTKVFVYEVSPIEGVSAIAFHDMHVMCSSVCCFKNYVVVGDVCRGVSMFYYQSRPVKMYLLGVSEAVGVMGVIYVMRIGMLGGVNNRVLGGSSRNMLEGVSNKEYGYKGVSNSIDKQHPVNYLSFKQHPLNISTYEQQGVNNLSNKQQGVNNLSFKQHPLNISTNEQQGVNNLSSKQHGVSNSIDKQHPLNISTNEQHPVNNLSSKQQGVNNLSFKQHP
ncbi:cleavage and polyadenylation specificity factor, partial [Hamiltosporidium tvaerminnensis]